MGIRCAFTDVVLRRMLDADVNAVAAVLPGPPGIRGLLESRPPKTLLPLAGARSNLLSGSGPVPVYSVGDRLDNEVAEQVSALSPDVIVVACFPRLIPRSVRETATFGAINIHPSLLPVGRGPDPLFWTLRRGDGRAGITVHQLSSSFDSGPILDQQPLDYPDGTTEAELERAAATVGAELALGAIEQVMNGTAQPLRQDERLATWEPWPEDSDFVIDTNRSARAAFNFIRGVAARETPVTIRTSDGPVVVADAVAWHADATALDDAPGDLRAISFNPGTLLVREASS